jgi:hypothetical protein
MFQGKGIVPREPILTGSSAALTRQCDVSLERQIAGAYGPGNPADAQSRWRTHKPIVIDNGNTLPL